MKIQTASDNGLIFVSSFPSTIQAINSTTAVPFWTSNLGGELIGKLAVNEGHILAIIKTQKTLRSVISIDSLSGITNWKKEFDFTQEASLYTFDSSVTLVEDIGIIRVLNLTDGKVLKEVDLKEEISASFGIRDLLVLGTVQKKIYFFSVSEGKIVEELSTDEIPKKILALDNEDVIWTDRKGLARRVNIGKQKVVWKIRFGGEVSNISLSANNILISSQDNFIYLINKITGKLKWRKRLSGRVIEEPLVNEDVVVLFVYGDTTGLIISLRTGKMVNAISLSDADGFIGGPIYTNQILLFATLKGLSAYSNNECPKK